MKLKRIISLALAAASIAGALALVPAPVFAADSSQRIYDGNNSVITTEKTLLDLGISVMYVDTEDSDYITSRLKYKNAAMRIALSEEFASYTNEYTSAGGGAVRLKGRGNSTWNNGYPDGKANTLPGDTHTRKVPYNLKLDIKTDLFGLGKAKNWVLVSNYMDRTMLRNKLIYDVSGKFGMLYTKSVFVNLVLNGEYMGVYMLCQKINANLFDGEVVDWGDVAEDVADAIAEATGLDEDGREKLKDDLEANSAWITSGVFGKYKISDYVDISGYYPYTGLLLEYDWYADEDSFFVTNHNVPIKVKNLESIKTNEDMYSYLTSYLYYFEEALYSDTFYNSAGVHYSEYLDMQSFVDYFILNMVMLNVEFGYKSMFMYINDDGKLVLGPMWDYDWSSGNPFLNSNNQYEQWYNDGRAGNNHWYHQVYSDPWFVSLVRERWNAKFNELCEILDLLVYYEGYLSATEEIEYLKFSNDPYESDFARRTGGRSFEDECDQLHTFLTKRISWMDKELGKRDPNIEFRGFKSNNTFELDVTGGSSEITSFDPKETPFVCDGESSEFQDLTVKTTVTAGDNVKVFLNGYVIRDKEVTSPKGNVTVNIAANKLQAGINVITVMRSGPGGSDVVYYSVKMPGVKSRILSAGETPSKPANIDPDVLVPDILDPSDTVTDPTKTEYRVNSASVRTIVLLTVAISVASTAICAVIVIATAVTLKRKKKKSAPGDGSADGNG